MDGERVAEDYGATSATNNFGAAASLAHHYFQNDYQNTIGLVTTDNYVFGSAATTPQNEGSDVFGQPRGASGKPNPDPNWGANDVTKRRYINQEDLTDAQLIDLNARVYDPLFGKFLSPDPVISDQDDSQSWNAYAYSHNNPMSDQDPTGLADSPGSECDVFCSAATAIYAGDPGTFVQQPQSYVQGTGSSQKQMDIAGATKAYADGAAVTDDVRADIARYVASQLQVSVSSLLGSPRTGFGAFQPESFPSNALFFGQVVPGYGTPDPQAPHTDGPISDVTLQLLGILATPLTFGASAEAVAAEEAPPLAYLLEGHSAGQGFTGVFDTSNGNILIAPSTADADIPAGWVARSGGHIDVSNMLGGDAENHVGFAAILQEDGSLGVTWRSGSLNPPPSYLVPDELRQPIINALGSATGRSISP